MIPETLSLQPVSNLLRSDTHAETSKINVLRDASPPMFNLHDRGFVLENSYWYLRVAMESARPGQSTAWYSHAVAKRLQRHSIPMEEFMEYCETKGDELESEDPQYQAASDFEPF